MPLDAAWRCENGWTWQHELAAAHVEATAAWGRNVSLLLGAKPRQLPEPLHIDRPAPARTKRREVETDPRKIAAFFKQHVK